jgi:hypothetical protein
MLKHFFAIGIYCLATFYITYPLLFHLGTYTTGLGDELIIAWIQNWVVHAILSGNIISIFDANVFYPFNNSLAFSDIFITSSIISLIPLQIIKEPIVANNITLLSSLIMLGFSIYLLCFYLTKDFLASLLSGILVIFSPTVLDKTTHLQVLAIQWVPLSILFLLVFMKSQKSKFLALSLLFFLLQTYNSFLPGYFIVFSYSIILIFYIIYQKKKTIKLFNKNNILLLIIAFVLIVPSILPYYSVSNEFNYVRDIRESIHLGLQTEDLLYTNARSKLMPLLNNLPINKTSQNYEFKPGYIGLVFSLLSLIVIFYCIKFFKKKNIYLKIFISIAFLGLILSFGAFLHINRQTVHSPFPIPLPYALFYYIAPGFQGFRNAARWEMLFILAIAVVIAIVLHELLKKYSFKKRIFIYGLLIIGTVVEFNFPMQFVKVPEVKNFPAVYSWLQTTPQDTKIIEMPIYNWNMWPHTQQDLFRQYYSTVHFRKMVNGASGFSPPPWQTMIIDLLIEFPNEKSLAQLRNLDIDYIIVHKDQYDILHKEKYSVEKHYFEDGEHIIEHLSKNSSVRLVKKFGNDYIYELK